MKNKIQNNPIGIFDSGIGGLTVLKEVEKLLPNENIIYLGDTARVPYGGKSPEVVRRYSKENVEFLLEKGVKMIVIACNTASATSISFLKKEFKDVEFVGVIDPVVDAIKRSCGGQKIGIVGTNTTIKSKVYQDKIRKSFQAEVFAMPCPMFVPLVEEGLSDSALALMTAEMYLREMRDVSIDTLILACTHYPLLSRLIDFYFQGKVKIMNSAFHVAQEVKKSLIDNKIGRVLKEDPLIEYFVTDQIDQFKENAEIFLDLPIKNIKKI